MTRDSVIGLLRTTTLAPGAVRQVDVPTAARAISTLAHIDYEDAFLVDIGPVGDRTGEQWARAIFEEAPASRQIALRRGWSTLGLQLAPSGSTGFVLGWEVRLSTTDLVLLGVRGSRLGLSAELLVRRDGDRLHLNTFVQKEHQLAHALWALVELAHPRVVQRVLEEASRRERRKRHP